MCRSRLTGLVLVTVLSACRSKNTADTQITTDTQTNTQTTTDTETKTSTDTQTTTDTETKTSTPCDPSPGIPGQNVTLTMNFDGVQRTAVLRLPADYDCEPLPLLIGVHGYYGSGQDFSSQTSGIENHIDDHDYIGLFPNGLSMSQNQPYVTSFNDLGSRNDTGPDGQTCINNPYDYGAYTNCGADELNRTCKWGTSCADDAGWFRALIEDVSTQWTVDEDRIFMTGFSQGGQTVQSFACPLADLLAAVAPAHGFSANGYTCGPQTKLSMMQVWGQSDNIVPGNGYANDGYIYDTAEETAAQWAESQGCEDQTSVYPTVSDGTRQWACVSHPHCATDAKIVNCSWEGGHNWPSNGLAGNFILDAMWAFFEENPR